MSEDFRRLTMEQRIDRFTEPFECEACGSIVRLEAATVNRVVCRDCAVGGQW